MIAYDLKNTSASLVYGYTELASPSTSLTGAHSSSGIFIVPGTPALGGDMFRSSYGCFLRTATNCPTAGTAR